MGLRTPSLPHGPPEDWNSKLCLSFLTFLALDWKEALLGGNWLGIYAL